MKAYTRTGDKGDTGLYSGDRVPKNNPRVDAYGDVDELNSHIGLVRTELKDKNLNNILGRVQRDLFTIGGELATPDLSKKIPRLTQKDIETIEQITDSLNDNLPPLTKFILPGGTRTAAQVHVARTVCRRTERKLVGLSQKEMLSAIVVPYLNRLSSLLFVMARKINYDEHVPEEEWVHE